MDKLKIDAKWTDDCQGKKDYDGGILSVCTHYWPRGGGYGILKRVVGETQIEGNEARPEVKPCAKSSILLHHSDECSITLVEKEFEGETQEEVQAKVEEWAQAQYEEIVALLKMCYEIKL